MINLKRLIKLQALFAALSLGYLVASAVRQSITGAPFSAAAIWPSILLFLIYCAALSLPRFGKIGLYRSSMVLALVPFGIGGVILNVTRYLDSGLAEYSSTAAWAIAVSFNLYGTILNIIAALGAFQRDLD